MMHCLNCASVIEENEQSYLVEDMGPDIVVQFLKIKLDENGAICSQCFAHYGRIICQSKSAKCPSSNTATIVCVCCQRRLGRGSYHSVLEGPERISPRQIPEVAVVCHLCWTKAQQTLHWQGVSYVPSSNTFVCVWCLRSLANRRRHSIPEGPEQNEIIARIHPRSCNPINFISTRLNFNKR